MVSASVKDAAVVSKTPRNVLGTPSPVPAGCFPCFRFGKKKPEKLPALEKQEKKKGEKKKGRRHFNNKVAPLPPISQPVSQKPSSVEMLKSLQTEQVATPAHLKKASLSVSGGAQARSAGITYELTDHERPPSRAYGRPGSRNGSGLMPPRRLARLDLHKERESMQKEMQAKGERREIILQEKVRKAKRSTERGQQVREKKMQNLLSNANLSVTDVTNPRKGGESWVLEDTRPATPAGPRAPSRSANSTARLPPIDLAAKQVRSEKLRLQAQEEKLVRVRLNKERHEKSRERRQETENEYKDSAKKQSQQKTGLAKVRHEAHMQRRQSRAARDVERARRLSELKRIERQRDEEAIEGPELETEHSARPVETSNPTDPTIQDIIQGLDNDAEFWDN